MPGKLRNMIKKYLDKRAFVIFTLFGFLFSFFQFTGWELARTGNILWTGAYTARLLFACLLAGILFGGVGSFLWVRFSVMGADTREAGTEEKRQDKKQDKKSYNSWMIWGLSFGLILLCFLPGFLAYYPGICAYDTTIQLGQVAGGTYNDHHPIAHTLLLAGSMRLGDVIFGDVNAGLAMLVFLQMLLLAGTFAWGIVRLAHYGVKRWILIGLQIFAMCYPFHIYMSVSVCKDVFFSIFFLLQMLALYEMIKSGKFAGFDVLFVISSVGMQLFRNNGRYAMLVLMAMLVLAVLFAKGARRFFCRITIECLLALVIGSLCINGLFEVTKAEQGDRREMLSMPIQQLARCMIYHGGVGVMPEDDASMKAEDIALVNDFLLDESYKEYRPDIADPVKRHTNTYVVRYRTGEFVRMYLGLLGEYPGDFINATLAVNAGFLYVGDESHATINQNGRDKGLGYVQTRFLTEELNGYGIYQDSKWAGLYERLEKWADENAYLKIPVLRYLFVPGVIFWLYVLLAACLFLRRNYRNCMPLSLVLGYYATMFLGPTVQLRYVYPMLIALPFVAVLALGKPGECRKNQ